MNFEEQVRERISAAAFGSTEKNILKLILGECQQELGNLTDEKGHNIVKKMIKANEESLGYLEEGDLRVEKLREENQILSTLLPSYWSADQIRAELVGREEILSAKSDGQATGLAMKHLKTQNAPVEGGTVKDVVAALRAS